MASCQDWRYSYWYMTLYADVTENNSGGGYSRVHWRYVLTHSRLSTSRGFNWSVNIGGQVYSGTTPALNYPSGKADYTIAENDTIIYHRDGMNISFSFSAYVSWNIYPIGVPREYGS